MVRYSINEDKTETQYQPLIDAVMAIMLSLIGIIPLLIILGA